jgi:hypothetical protein
LQQIDEATQAASYIEKESKTLASEASLSASRQRSQVAGESNQTAALLTVQSHSCDDDMVLEDYGMASTADALQSRTHSPGAAFAALPHLSLVACGAAAGFTSGGSDENVSRSGALAKCEAMPGCFAVDYLPNRGLGVAYYCTDRSLQTYYNVADDAGMAHYYKVQGAECVTRVTGNLFTSASQLCDTDMVLASHAASPADALTMRTTRDGAAFAALPQRDLEKCGDGQPADIGVSRQAALLKCGSMPGCFAVDFWPRALAGVSSIQELVTRIGQEAVRQHWNSWMNLVQKDDEAVGNAYYCTDSSLGSFGYVNSDIEMVHLYKVNGTSCGTSSRQGARVCDADMVLSQHAASQPDAMYSRTSATNAAFATLSGSVLKNCGSTEVTGTDISRKQAVANCRARSDCFAVDYHPISPRVGNAFYCTNATLSTFSTITTRLRGSNPEVEHLYKVRGASCACSLAE